MHKEEKRNILEFNNVTWRDSFHLVADISGFSMTLAPCELAVILQHEHADQLPICDLASGLVDPLEGQISFLGIDWRNMSPCQQSDMRAKTGRVFEHSSWVSNLSVYDNIVLSELHNTVCPDSEIRAKAEALARELDVGVIPDGRPDAIRPVELRKCELVRAFLGSPVLFLLESPESGLPEGTVSRLKDMLAKALERGAAAIWITRSEKIWAGIEMRNVRKFKKEDEKMIIEGERNDA